MNPEEEWDEDLAEGFGFWDCLKCGQESFDVEDECIHCGTLGSWI